MHKRKMIRESIVADLIAGDITGVESRVFSNRPTPAFRGELPAIFVYTTTSEAGSENATRVQNPIIYKRILNISVEIVAEATENVDSDLDDIAEEVEQVIGDNQEKYQQGLKTVEIDDADVVIENVGTIDLERTDIALVDSGAKIVGSCKIGLSVPYWGPLGEPADPVDDLETIHTDIAKSTDTDVVLAEVEQDFSQS